MLTRMRLTNFKSWADTGDIPLRPITGFFGTNSSGKTSVFQALLLMQQTADSRDRRVVLHFGGRQSPVDLGDFASVVHEHDVDRALGIALDWQAKSPLKIVDVESGRTVVASKSIGFESSLQAGIAGRKKSPTVAQMSYRVGKAQFGMQWQESNGRYEQFAAGADFDFARRQGRSGQDAPGKFYSFPETMRASFRNADFVADLELSLENCLQNIYYLGPLRARPERNYAWSGEQPSDMGDAGELAVAAIIASRERGHTIGLGKGRRRLTLEQYIAQWLKTLGLIHDFRITPVADGSQVYEVKVRKSRNSAEVLITDVGFGVSQILPVLALCFYVPRGSTVLLEQPEIHLHPMAQSELADVFIDVWEKRNVQVLVESHSEHLLQRLQRRIAEERFSQAEVSLLFCSPENGHSVMTPLQVDSYGSIENWPEHFFGDQFGEIATMSKAMIARMRNDNERQ